MSLFNFKYQIEQSKEKNISYFYKVGAYWAAMVGFGETYISPFAIFLGASRAVIALLVSLPQLIGPLIGLVSANIVDRVKDRKLLTILGVLTQAIMWIPFCIAVFLPTNIAIIVVIISFTIYASTSYFNAPPWISLVGDIIPEDKRGHYIGFANVIIHTIILVTSFVAGEVLDLWSGVSHLQKIGFLILFGAAFIVRIISMCYVSLMYESTYTVQKGDYFSFIDFIRRAPQSNFVRFVFYVAFFNFSMYIAAPFFAVYMLRDLKFNYLQFAIASNALIIGIIATISYWGKLADRFGNKKILTVTGYGVVLCPLLWLISTSPIYIYIIQFYAGVMWSGFGLSIGNFIFDAVTPPKRARCTAYFNVINGFAIFLGAMLGGFIAEIIPNTIYVFGLAITPISSLLFVFAISGISRFIVNLLFLTRFKEVRKVEPISTADFILHFLHLR